MNNKIKTIEQLGPIECTGAKPALRSLMKESSSTFIPAARATKP